MSLMPHGHQAGLFIQAKPDAVADCLVQWGHEPIVNRSTIVQRELMTLEEAWAYVGERRATPDRGFLIPIHGSWTAFFDNHRDEYLAGAEPFVLSERLRCDTCCFAFDHRPNFMYQSSAYFYYYRFDGHAIVKRSVSLYKEDSWIFQQIGPALPFERIDRYTLPEPRDRLDAETLRDYGRALGIPFWDPGAYGKSVILLSWNTKPRASQAQVEKAIERMTEGYTSVRVLRAERKLEANKYSEGDKGSEGL